MENKLKSGTFSLFFSFAKLQAGGVYGYKVEKFSTLRKKMNEKARKKSGAKRNNKRSFRLDELNVYINKR